MAVSSYNVLQVNGSFRTRLISHSFSHLKTSLSSTVKVLYIYLYMMIIIIFERIYDD